MVNKNPIYIIDDDHDDEDIIRDAFKELGIDNEVRFFDSGETALSDLRSREEIPFIILSSVNLPKMDGFELREKILKEFAMTATSIPFIFWSTNASPAQIKKAYELSAHGFFLKGRTFADLKSKIQEIVSYWSDSLVPEHKM